MAKNTNQYGLIMPKKANHGLLLPRPSVFEDSSNSEEEGGADWVKKVLKQESVKSLQKKQTQLEIQRAINEDPTVYQYDEVYDKIEEKKLQLKNVKKAQDKKPRYIQSLLKEADRRKREQERRNERQIQKERETEGEEFKDKEAFVTSAYRQKLEEFKKLDEEEKRMDHIEALTDVSKQQDLSGFYRHLFKQTVEGEKVPDETKIKEEKLEESKVEDNEAEEKKGAEPEKVEDNVVIENTKPIEQEKKGRQYRKRKASSSSLSTGSSDSESDVKKEAASKVMDVFPSVLSLNQGKKQKTKKNQKSRENIDADSDFSVDGSGSANESDKEDKRTRNNKHKKLELKKSGKVKIASGSEDGEIQEVVEDVNGSAVAEVRNEENSRDSKEDKKEDKEEKKPSENDTETKAEEKEPQKPKPSIWEKRTVGEVFDAAVARYYQRKAAKLANQG